MKRNDCRDSTYTDLQVPQPVFTLGLPWMSRLRTAALPAIAGHREVLFRDLTQLQNRVAFYAKQVHVSEIVQDELSSRAAERVVYCRARLTPPALLADGYWGPTRL
jgi:hypothetical protein